jgi:hypothetical protein
MKKLSDIISNPSGFDSLENYIGEVPSSEWYVVLTTSRDADVLTRSNFESAQKALEGFEDDVEVFRFGHWACGWWEALCVREGTKAFEEGESLANSLEAYPVLDEEAFCQAEEEEALEVWANCYRVRDRIRYIRENRRQFEFSSFAELLSCVRGNSFGGWASELLH